MNADGTGIRTLAELPGHTFHGSPCWSHDGKQVAFDATVGGAQNDHIFIVDAAGGEPRDLGLGSQPSWSGDDKQICFFTLSNNPAGETVGVWLMNADGNSRQYLMPGIRSRWSNDGGKIAYIDYSKGVNITVYSLLDGETKTLLNEQFNNISPPAWSEDGKQICFVGLRARSFRLRTLRGRRRRRKQNHDQVQRKRKFLDNSLLGARQEDSVRRWG